jgi:hypothetical protein
LYGGLHLLPLFQQCREDKWGPREVWEEAISGCLLHMTIGNVGMALKAVLMGYWDLAHLHLPPLPLSPSLSSTCTRTALIPLLSLPLGKPYHSRRLAFYHIPAKPHTSLTILILHMTGSTSTTSSSHRIILNPHHIPLPLPIPHALAWIFAPNQLTNPRPLHTSHPHRSHWPVFHQQKKKSSNMPKVSAKEGKTSTRAAPAKRTKKDKDPNKPKR